MKHQRFNEIYPYTYYIKHIPSGFKYYGVRFANIKLGLSPSNDLGIKYFTSIRNGDFSWFAKLFKSRPQDFLYKIHYTFDSINEAIVFESKILSRIIGKKDWCNQCNIIENNFVNRISFCCCIYCRKELDKGNFYQSHGNKCIMGPNYVKRCHSPERKEHLSKLLKGREYSPETIARMSAGQLNRVKKRCIHCDIEFDPGNYSKYHGDKCRYFSAT